MKRFFVLAALTLLGACAAVQEAAQMAECKYALKSVEVSEFNITSLSFDLTMAITNMSKKQAASIKRFEGTLEMNEIQVADVTFKDIRVEPNSVQNAKAHFSVPMSSFNSKLLGLVSMGSGTVDYHLKGIMYMEGPLGVEIPVPVDIGRVGSYNN